MFLSRPNANRLYCWITVRTDEKRSQSFPLAGWFGHFNIDLRYLPSLSLVEKETGLANAAGRFGFSFLLYSCAMD